MPNILGIIPARGGSKGLKRKNLQLLDSKPLIWYTLNTAKQSQYIDKLVVSTDDDVIADYVKSQGVDVIPRPIHLATDRAVVVDALIYTVDFLASQHNYQADIIVNLNPTSPLRTLKSLDKALHKIINNDYDSVFSARITFDNQNRNYGRWEIIEGAKLKSLYDHFKPKRRQDFYNNYFVTENGAIYALKKEVLFKHKSLIGENPGFIVMSGEESIDIDTETQLAQAEVIYKLMYKE